MASVLPRPTDRVTTDVATPTTTSPSDAAACPTACRAAQDTLMRIGCWDRHALQHATGSVERAPHPRGGGQLADPRASRYRGHNTTYRLGSWVPIPRLNAVGYLPDGEYLASLEEVGERFSKPGRRQMLFDELSEVVGLLRDRGVEDVWVTGSYVTERNRPRDVDVIYDPPPGADTGTWGLLSFARHDELHDLHRIDLWPLPSWQAGKTPTDPLITIKDFFSSDRSDIPRGIIKLAEANDSD